MSRLSDAEIAQALEGLAQWSHRDAALVRTIDAGSFPAAVALVVRLGFLAEAANHHPDISIGYSRVTVALTTHDQGGVTAQDVAMASRIDDVVDTAEASGR